MAYKKNVTFATNQVSALFGVLAIGSHIARSLLVYCTTRCFLRWEKMAEGGGGGGGGGSNATVITNKKHLSHLCNLFSFNMRSMLVGICEF